MAYRKPRVPPQFADLISTLAQSKSVDPALYQVVQEIINRLNQFSFESVDTTGGGGGGGGGGAGNLLATYHTKANEVATLPNSVQLIAGTGISFGDSVANKRTITNTGVPGPAGPQGIQGPAGPQGIQGPIGIQGPTGIAEVWYSGVGPPSPDAPVANVGDWYLDSSTGIVYEQVAPNSWTQRANIKGPAGVQGSQGIPGATGPQGEVGPQGPVGNTGEQGIQGIKGDTGNTGPEGPEGPIGNQGPQGEPGPQGTVGPTGPQGLQGPQGPTGPTGAASTVPGPPGAQGPPGPTGSTPTLDQTFITVNAEATLPNERALVAGTNVTLDTTVAGQIRVNAGGGGMNLDYLGDYVGGPTYYDGDIVIGPDGIAYMCTVDGTTTPPEPWPGIGVSTVVGPQGPPGPAGPQGPAGTGGIVDATYWTSTPHAGLTNERALNGLANGYVFVTSGEPSTVFPIPLSHTSESLPDARLSSNVALKNINNFFVAQTFPPETTITGAYASLNFNVPGSPANAKNWRWIKYADTLMRLESLNDVGTIQASFNFGIDGNLGSASFTGGGGNLTSLNASYLATGLVATPRLGSGTADTSTFLRGDQTWAIPGGVPAGAVILFNAAACPPGYTRIAAWDGYYIRMGPAVTSGGANSHTHGVGSYAVPAHTHSAGSLAVDAHSHGTVSVSGSTGSGGSHTHTFSDNYSGTTGGESNGVLTVDGGSSGSCSRGSHTHSFSGSVSGTTSSDGSHTHSFSGSGATSNASPNVNGNTGSTGSNVAVTGASAAANNMPLYIDMLACQKN